MIDVHEDRDVLRRVVERLRSMPESRLTRGDASGTTLAEAVHELAQWAASAGGRPEPVPVLHPLASGDQLAVIGREFLGQAARDHAPLPEWQDRIRRLRDRL